MNKTVFSGIQPSGEIHIGNYLGAIQNWITLLDSYECFFCIVDYHAITVKYDVKDFQDRVWNAIIDNIACGIDPEKSHLFIQSHVPEHTELAWILNSVAPIGDLERMTQYKDKSKQHKENINAGLFTYPVLQTADIILYKATHVPVGEDQVQHIEFARRIVKSFNHRFGKIFPEPKELLSKAPRILGLDGKAKMSKSMGNYIAIGETQEVLKKKVMSAVTDEKRIRRNDPGDPAICNVFSLHQFFTSSEKRDEIETQCKNGTIGCVDCKKLLINGIWATLEPIQEKRMALLKDQNRLKEIIYENGKRCKQIAENTMGQVKERMGIR